MLQKASLCCMFCVQYCRSFIPNVVLYDRKGNETRETIFDVSVENKTCPCVNRKDEVKSTKEITCLLPHVFEIDPQAQVTWRNVRHYHIQNYCNRNDLKSTDFKGIVHAKQWTLAGNVLTFRPSKCHVDEFLHLICWRQIRSSLYAEDSV